MKKLLVGMLVVLAVGAAIGLTVLAHMERWSQTRLIAAPRPRLPRLVDIRPGSSLRAVAARLEREGIIDSALRFELLGRLRGWASDVQAGQYRLGAHLTPVQIARILTAGRVHLHRLTVPEGYTVAQIARLTEIRGLCPAAAFIERARDGSRVRNLGVPAASLEGYLFPDTYLLAYGADCDTLLQAMTDRFRQVFDAPWRERARELGLSVNEVVTLASIVEKETGVAAERPLIASVFHNRLQRRMRLQSDPTVIYGLGERFKGNLTRAHLREPGPYNTYRIAGLPPGPIANPGRAALEAALFPADSDYLYFVAKPDRTHHFSKTLAEHNRAVQRHQIQRRP